MRRVLVVTHSYFWRKQNGAAFRIYSLIAALQSAGYEVGLFFVGLLQKTDCCQLDKLGISHRNRIIDGITLSYRDFFTASPYVWRCLPRYLLRLWYRFIKKSFPFKGFRHFKVIQRFERFMDFFDPEIVLVEYIRFSFLLSQERSEKRLWLIDTHDVMYKRFDSFKQRGLLHWVAVTRAEEAEALAEFDAVVAIQQQEAELFRDMIGNSNRVLIVPHAVDILPLPIRESKEVCVGFLAADNSVNYDAIAWFLDRIWPVCLAKVPSSRLRIGGTICRRLKGTVGKRVELVGYVNLLTDFYSAIDLIVNPVRSGGGLKIKNVEALAVGRPLVTTPVGAQGFPQADIQPFVVASSEQEFILELTDLIQNAERRDILRRHGLDYVKKYFSPEEVYKPLHEFLMNASYKPALSRD